MEFIILLIVLITIYFILKYVFDSNTKKIKEIAEDKELDELTQKYPENIEICKEYLEKLNNKDVIIEEDKDSNTTLYLVMSNKIFIANLKNNYTRIQTIAHECLHSIQSKRLLWFNFIFSNIYLLYLTIICILAILKILPYKMMFFAILTLFGLIYYAVRMYLENDAMIKAKFLAKEYMEEKNISSKEEIEKIIKKYDKLNDVGIKCTNFQLFSSIIIKCIIFVGICIISTI
ncbi:MAG: hypothetical protein IJE05_02355 [Clostridia bacterium]|nr:hypothetical protein [Clostridia bacterium]